VKQKRKIYFPLFPLTVTLCKSESLRGLLLKVVGVAPKMFPCCRASKITPKTVETRRLSFLVFPGNFLKKVKKVKKLCLCLRFCETVISKYFSRDLNMVVENLILYKNALFANFATLHVQKLFLKNQKKYIFSHIRKSCFSNKVYSRNAVTHFLLPFYHISSHMR